MRPCLAVALCVMAMLPCSAIAAYRVEGGCRDGQPHGAYELRSASGKLVAIGAFNRGRRTGSFIFWNDAGVRVAHLPYDDDLLSGTVATWYPSPVKAGVTPQKRETRYAGGRRNGSGRSWWPDGKLRVEADYRDGVLVSARAFGARGQALPEQDALAAARADEAADREQYRALEERVRLNSPRCAADARTRNGS